jgi:enoyl-CoA hydratase/carnithine racemase
MYFNYSRQDSIGYIKLKSPAGNSMQNPVLTDMEELKDFLNSGIKAAIITGEGHHFSSGADVNSIGRMITDPRKFEEDLNYGNEILEVIRDAGIPTLAAIKGACLGGGLELALACTFRFVTPNSILGFPEAGIGLMPGFGGTVTDLIPRSLLVKLILNAHTISGEEALEAGLAQECWHTKELMEKSEKFLHTLVEHRSLKQIHYIMESISNSYKMDRDKALKRETELFIELAQNLET